MVQTLVNDLKSLNLEFTTYRETTKATIENLNEECTQLKMQNQELQTSIKSLTESAKSNITRPISDPVVPDTYAKAVQSSVRNALLDDRARSEVIVSRINETSDAHEAIRNICSKVNFVGNLSDVRRVGKKTDGRDRPLKVTFGNPFDARTFCSRVDGSKEEHEDIAELKVRLGKTKEELVKYKERKEIAKKLNEKAKEENIEQSYSLRDNGEIWLYKKKSNNKWVRDSEWSLPAEHPNEQQQPWSTK